jgi:hypothetical protein
MHSETAAEARAGMPIIRPAMCIRCTQTIHAGAGLEGAGSNQTSGASAAAVAAAVEEVEEGYEPESPDATTIKGPGMPSKCWLCYDPFHSLCSRWTCRYGIYWGIWSNRDALRDHSRGHSRYANHTARDVHPLHTNYSCRGGFGGSWFEPNKWCSYYGWSHR